MLKFLLLILAILAVWYGFRYVNRPRPDSRPESTPATPPGPPPAAPSGQTREAGAEDMTACRVCSTYVAESTAKSCGRSDCPYPPA